MSVIKYKKAQLSKILRTQIILIVDFFVNEIYPLVKNKISKLLNDPNVQVVLIAILLVLIALTLGSGNDAGGS